MKKFPWVFLLFFAILLAFPAAVQADGIIIPPLPPCHEFDCPPFPRPMAQLEIRYHRVSVTIENQLARTKVDQVFFNPNDWAIEGTYVFPLPMDAVVSEFTLWVDGKPVTGEVMNAEEARRYYEEVVSSLRDPALLEYFDRGAMRASVFPIPPQRERRIELEYTQVLAAQNGLVRYIYPLNTEKYSLEPLQDVSIRVEIQNDQHIRAVYSPSHPVAIDRRDSRHVIAGYEEQNVLPDADFSLFYSIGESEAFHLFSLRDPADPLDEDGFFLLLLAPKPDAGTERVAKDVMLVLDRSGSMEGEKFQQAKSALRFILSKLNPEDRFYVQAFSTGLETYASGLRSASEVNEALAWVDRLSVVGSTDINRALLEAASVVDSQRPTYLIFLTDGLPTEGVVNTAEILANFARSAPPNLRLFPFGVGYDVDTVLLDTLSQEHHGQSTYVRPDDALDEVLSGFYERISTPVLTDLELDFGKIAVYDLYPNPLPDLFSGSQVIVAGRYREGGVSSVRLSGEVNGKRQVFTFEQQEFSTDSRGSTNDLEALPRLWATRKIGYLLNRIRLDGPDKETIQQIVRLSVRYGIITPYTSYLVTEPMPLGIEEQDRIVEDQFGQAQETPLESSGKSAVERANQEGQMQAADVAPAAPQAGDTAAPGMDTGAAIRIVGSKTFLYQGGIWIDTLYDPKQMEAQPIGFLSGAYFQFLDTRPDLAPYLALGDQVIVVVGEKAYQVVGDGEQPADIQLPEPLPTATPETVSPAVETVIPTPAAVDQPPVGAAQPQGSRACLSFALVPLALFLSSLRRKAVDQ